jgi:hypothetical protein
MRRGRIRTVCGPWLVAGLAALAAGCLDLPTCPAKGGPAWSEWTSPHFRLLIDVTDEEAAERLATELEQFRAAILATAWRDAPEPADLLGVIALRSAYEADAAMAPRTLAEIRPFFWREFRPDLGHRARGSRHRPTSTPP